MLPKHSYIKDIKKIVEEKARKLKLKPLSKLTNFIKENKRFYSVPCLKEKEKLFFKILIVNEIAPIEAIKREIEVRKFLSKFRKKINFPHLIAYDNQNFPYWFLSQYLEGKLLGHFYNFYLNNEKYIPKIINFLLSLHKIPSNDLKRFSQKKESLLWKRDFGEYFRMIKSYRERIEKEISKEIDFKKIYQLFEKEKSSFEKSSLVLAHGDFTLANIVVSGEKLIIADWEQAHLDNFLYDFSHLWIQLWRYPDWQKKLILEFSSRLEKEKKEEFKKLFRLIIITEALGELCFSINLCEKKYKAKAKRAAQNTIKAALRGFNYLI